MTRKQSYLLLAVITLPLSYLLFTYAIQIYFYGLIFIFFLIFLQTPKPSKTVDHNDLDRSRYFLKLLTVLTACYGLGGFLGILI